MSDIFHLETNILGRIFNSYSLTLHQNELSVTKRKAESLSFDLHKMRSFGSLECFIFGAQFTFKYERQEYCFRFLSKKSAEKFTQAFNLVAKESINAYLIQVFSEFNLLAIKAYPRDSHHAQIDNLITELYQFYKYQPQIFYI